MTTLPLTTESSCESKRGHCVERLVRLLVWRGIPGRLCSGPYWVIVPAGETLEQSRWTDSAEWIQGVSDWRRDRIKRLFGVADEIDFARRYPLGVTIATDGRFHWRRLGLPNVGGDTPRAKPEGCV